jgi:pimeloyl-ACP methyl ester carboxylesterase
MKTEESMARMPQIRVGKQMLRSSARLFTASRTAAAVDLNFVSHAPSPGASPTPLRAPLVVFHGLLGSASNWRLLTRFPALTRDRHVIFAELRNHGTSPHADDMSWHALAADAVRLLDRIGADRCALLGHSLGGKMAMAAALLYPTRIERLVVADIAPTHYESHTNEQWGSVSRVVRALAALPVGEVRDRASGTQTFAPCLV